MKRGSAPEIEGLLLDLDNTLIQTSKIFFAGTRDVTQMYARVLPEVGAEQIAGLLQKVDRRVHAILSVNPNRWKTVVPELERELGIMNKSDSIAGAALERLAQIYTQVPEFEPGAQEVLQLAREWGLMLGLVTHANVEWTIFKLEALGLQTAFDHVAIIHEDQLHKQPSDWSDAAHSMQAAVPSTMVVGDNVISDVQAAVKAGFGAAVWVDDANGWSVVKEGTVPEQAHVIKGIAQLPQLPHFSRFSQ